MQRIVAADGMPIFADDDVPADLLVALSKHPDYAVTLTPFVTQHTFHDPFRGLYVVFFWIGLRPPTEAERAVCREDPAILSHGASDGLSRGARLRHAMQRIAELGEDVDPILEQAADFGQLALFTEGMDLAVEGPRRCATVGCTSSCSGDRQRCDDCIRDTWNRVMTGAIPVTHRAH